MHPPKVNKTDPTDPASTIAVGYTLRGCCPGKYGTLCVSLLYAFVRMSPDCRGWDERAALAQNEDSPFHVSPLKQDYAAETAALPRGSTKGKVMTSSKLAI